MAAPAVELGVEAATGLVRAPRALLVVDRGFALVVVAEVWAAAAAAASVARFCNCRAFMPVEGRETPREQEAHLAGLQTRGQPARAGAPGSRPCEGTLCPAALVTRAPPRVPAEPPTAWPAACPHPGRVPDRPLPGPRRSSGKTRKILCVRWPRSCPETEPRAGRLQGGLPGKPTAGTKKVKSSCSERELLWLPGAATLPAVGLGANGFPWFPA